MVSDEGRGRDGIPGLGKGLMMIDNGGREWRTRRQRRGGRMARTEGVAYLLTFTCPLDHLSRYFSYTFALVAYLHIHSYIHPCRSARRTLGYVMRMDIFLFLLWYLLAQSRVVQLHASSNCGKTSCLVGKRPGAATSSWRLLKRHEPPSMRHTRRSFALKSPSSVEICHLALGPPARRHATRLRLHIPLRSIS